MESKYNDLFTTDMIIQLNMVMDKMERRLTLRFYPDHREVSEELLRYLLALQDLSDKIVVEQMEAREEAQRPYVRIFLPEDVDTGMCFHGVPGGHEFTPFILSLYNASGPGQPISDRDFQDVMKIAAPVHLNVMVSLNCTLCPEMVQAAIRIASLNPKVSVDIYDLNHFEEMRTKYGVQSVPCFTINDGTPIFGKKSLPALAELCLAAAQESQQ